MEPQNPGIFSELQSEKRLIALTTEELDALEAFLSDGWGIKYPGSVAEWTTRLNAEVEPTEVKRWHEFAARRALGATSRVDASFYDFIAQDPLDGIVHSVKWPYILDSAAFLTSVLRGADLRGSVLDIGCHAGYHSAWLAQRLDNEVIGIDASIKAIDLATRKSSAFTHRPTFVATKWMDFSPDRQFAAMVSIDSDIWMSKTSRHLPAFIRNWLQEDGLFIVSGDAVERGDEARIRENVKRCGLSFCLADVIGGWTGQSYEATSVLVFRKAAGPEVPAGLKALAESGWPGFRDYANQPGVSFSRKTQAIYRTWAGVTEGRLR